MPVLGDGPSPTGEDNPLLSPGLVKRSREVAEFLSSKRMAKKKSKPWQATTIDLTISDADNDGPESNVVQQPIVAGPSQTGEDRMNDSSAGARSMLHGIAAKKSIAGQARTKQVRRQKPKRPVGRPQKQLPDEAGEATDR